jgi:hypothetical protein
LAYANKSFGWHLSLRLLISANPIKIENERRVYVQLLFALETHCYLVEIYTRIQANWITPFFFG